MRRMHNHYTLAIKRVSILALVLTLWANIVYIEHQTDFDVSHHQAHHCALFTCLGNGLSNSVPIVPVMPQHVIVNQSTGDRLVTPSTIRVRAREPPQYSYLFTTS